MATALKLSDALVEAAKPYAAAMHRSLPKQIEYWARIGKAAEENPYLPVGFIIDSLVGIEEDRTAWVRSIHSDEVDSHAAFSAWHKKAASQGKRIFG